VPPLSPEGLAAAAIAGSGWRSTFSSLSNRNFLLLWLGLLALMGGVQMQMISTGYLAYAITSSPFLLGVVNAGFALPLLVLSLFGGAIADRIERKYIIQGGQAVAAALALGLGVAASFEIVTWPYLFLASFILGGLFAFMMPARQAIIPQLVGPERLTNAMALNAAGMSVMTLAAPALAGWLYAFLGPEFVYYIVATLALVAMLFTGLLPRTGAGLTRSAAPIRSAAPMMKDIAAGLVYIRQSKLVLALLVMGLATTLLALPFRFMMPVFVVDVYQMGPEAMGLLVSLIGAGSLAGSLFIASLGKWRRGLLMLLGTLLSAIGLLLVAAIPIYLVAAGVMLIMGFGDAVRQTLNQSLIMEEVEAPYRGRVMSVFMMNFGLMPLGVLPAGVIAEYLGAQAAVGILAALLMVITAIIFFTQKRLREMA
jgi:MFS family permease